jgi:uncharacterized protein (DUF1810 family)
MFAKFLSAQASIWSDVVYELKNEKKKTHWMWFVFPQLKGLGRSANAEFYGLSGRAEAELYLGHEILGNRVMELVRILLSSGESDPKMIFGFIDAKKMKSSLTLFSLVDTSGEQLFQKCLDKFFDGEKDKFTLELLKIK